MTNLVETDDCVNRKCGGVVESTTSTKRVCENGHPWSSFWDVEGGYCRHRSRRSSLMCGKPERTLKPSTGYRYMRLVAPADEPVWRALPADRVRVELARGVEEAWATSEFGRVSGMTARQFLNDAIESGLIEVTVPSPPVVGAEEDVSA